MLTRQELLTLQDTLSDALDFLKYFSDSPQELDDRVQKAIDLVEREIPDNGEPTERFEHSVDVLLQQQEYERGNEPLTADLQDAINNLYSVREINPTE